MPAGLALLAVVPGLLAADPAYYHPDDVAAASDLFIRASSRTAGAFEQRQQALAEASDALGRLDRNAALCGSRAPDELKAHVEAVRREATGQFLKIQAFVDVLTEDFQETFGEALQRAIQDLEGDWTLTQCRTSGVQAMMGKGGCEGENLNPVLARALDVDPGLQAEVAEILEVPWPDFELQPESRPPIPVTGSEHHAHLGPLADAFLQDRIEAVDAWYAEASSALEPVEETSSGTADPARMEERKALREEYDRKMAEVGDALFEALDTAQKRLEKDGLPPSLGLCANPDSLGGCEGEDVTGEVLPILQDCGRFVKAVSR